MKDRNRQPPYGWKFYVAETKWASPDNGSFDTVVKGLAAHISGHPELQAKGWSTDYATLANLVDEYNAAVCQKMNWGDWILTGGGPSAPFPSTSPVLQDHPLLRAPVLDQNKLAVAASSVKKIWSGIKTLNEWIDSGEPAVAPELSARRAEVCSTCPKNGQGDLTSWFTKPAADGIQKQLEKVQNRKLSTPFDDKLFVCITCYCPLRLKVHTPIVNINAHMGEQVRADLKAVVNPSGGCWITAEIWPEAKA